MDEKTIQRIKKLQALAERGVGGEKTTAQKKLAKLLKDNGINSLDELQKEEYEYTIFSYNGKHEIKLLRQCMYKVLLIDNDKQGNLSKAYSRYDAENVAPVTKLLAGDWESADELIQHTEYEGIDIVTANMSLFGATWNLTKEDSGNQIERYKALVYAKVQYYGDCTIYGKYDYCIIDNPPDIGLNVVNALAITDEVIVPVKVDEDALEGLDIVTEQIEDAKAFNPALKLAGVLITSYQNTDGEAAGVEWLEQKTDFNILGIIRYSKKVAENTFMRKPIYEYSPCCGAAQGYKKFVTAYTGKAR